MAKIKQVVTAAAFCSLRHKSMISLLLTVALASYTSKFATAQIISCSTTNHKINIYQNSEDKTFTYRSWNLDNSTNEKPDLEISGGVIETIDTSSNGTVPAYKFTNGETTLYFTNATLPDAPHDSNGTLRVVRKDEILSEVACSPSHQASLARENIADKSNVTAASPQNAENMTTEDKSKSQPNTINSDQKQNNPPTNWVALIATAVCLGGGWIFTTIYRDTKCPSCGKPFVYTVKNSRRKFLGIIQGPVPKEFGRIYTTKHCSNCDFEQTEYENYKENI